EEGGSVSAGNDPGILVVSEGRAAVLARQSRQIIVFKPVQGKLTQVNARKLDQKLRGLENLENGFAVLGEKSVLILGEDLADRSTISAEGAIALATGDLDGDGRADIAVLSSSGATAYYAKDNYQKPELFQGTAPGSDQATQGLIYQRKIYSSTPAGIFQMDREGALNRSDAPGRIVRGESGLFILETSRGQIRPMP
ncbi:MAG TPA: FG-GAP repeat protein, partial [Leptospiraceae bacterium]|nr:FG-GAP repeat protein [Leptospiraceae bacterium]